MSGVGVSAGMMLVAFLFIFASVLTIRKCKVKALFFLCGVRRRLGMKLLADPAGRLWPVVQPNCVGYVAVKPTGNLIYVDLGHCFIGKPRLSWRPPIVLYNVYVVPAQ